MDSYGNFNGDNFNGNNTVNDSTAMAIGSKIMIVAILVLFAVVIFVFGLQIYERCLWGRRASFRRRSLDFVDEQDPLRLQRVGLGKSAIEAIPVFVYQSENHKEGLECAVCLCEFEENEKARLLPKCHHSFHIDCIDMWLQSHSTCPLCRTSAQPDKPADSVVVRVGDEEAASEGASETNQRVLLPSVAEGNASTSMESDLDLCSSCRHDEVLPSPTYPTNMLFWATPKRVSSMSNSVFFEKGATSTSRKTLDKIIIDIPQRANSFSSPRLFCSDDQQVFSPSGQSLKSPSMRLRSLKRLLSKDKKVVPPSPDDRRNLHIEQGDSSQSRG